MAIDAVVNVHPLVLTPSLRSKMVSYTLSPYVHFIESRLRSDVVQYGVFNLLTGRVFEPSPRIRALLFAAKLGQRISLELEDLRQYGDEGKQIEELIKEEFLVADGYDALLSFAHHYVVRPLQNPAVSYRSETGKTLLVRLSMAERVFSPMTDQFAPIIEEEMPLVAARIFSLANGSRTLEEIALAETPGQTGIEAPAFREAIDFLTKPERQLVKLTLENEQLNQPNQPFNTVPRNFYHSPHSQAQTRGRDSQTLVDFHEQKIQNADWEFDVIEPTVNHAFRFPNEALGRLNYGARFCACTLKPEILPRLQESSRLNIMEVGGGTGSFARGFLEQARPTGVEVRYHLLDLAPTLIESQRKLLADMNPPVVQFQQNATEFDIPGVKFDLILANEVIADFPTAEVKRHQIRADVKDNTLRQASKWMGEGTTYLLKYELSTHDAPDYFVVNAGVFEFIERAWKHLRPGGALVVSEYGGEHAYPTEAFHLNHAEFSIHFGHVMECAKKVGFQCRLLTLGDFLNVDERVSMLSGSAEHIQCLNYVFKKHGASLEFRLISEREFNERFQELAARIDLRGYSFQPLGNNFHYGPNIKDFMVLIMSKPLVK